jgi:beta-lactamase superfamily II metal-dependent hydrolase
MKTISILAVLVLLLAGCAGKAPAPAADKSSTTAAPLPPSGLEVIFVDVGQGDGTVWRFPDGRIVVYDCGPHEGSVATDPMVKTLHRIGLKTGDKIYALVASHGHEDHIAGCSNVLSEFTVQNVWDTWYLGSDRPKSYQIFQDDVTKEGATVHKLGETLKINATIIDGPGYRAHVLWPGPLQVTDWDDIAENSIVVQLNFGSTSYCFAGDIEKTQESDIIDSQPNLKCSVLLAGHHGSQYASSGKWVNALRPSIVVVSTGKNSYGHPSSQALCRLQAITSNVYVTARLGNITVASDGATLAVSPDRPETRDYCTGTQGFWDP